MDNDSTRNGGPLSFTDTLSPLERAALGLQTSLSLFEVGKLTFPDNAKFQQSLVQTLISNAKMGNLPVYGNPDGWLADEYTFDASYNKVWSSRAYPLAEKHEGTRLFPVQACGLYRESYRVKQWHGDNCLVSHTDYFAFLKTPLALGIPSPKWLGAMPALPESIPPVETSLPELPGPARPKKRQRIDALNNAIRAALAVLSPSGALPRPHELFEHLAHNDATKTITGIAKGNRALLWIDDNGNEQRLTFSALSKRLDRIRQGD